MFKWTKQPSGALRKRREGDAAQRLANTLPDRLLSERLSLDGYTVAGPSRSVVQIDGSALDCPSRGKTLDVGLAQISVGLAWWVSRYADEQSPEDRGRYKTEEEEARLRKRGPWVDDAPIPPWDWRKQ